MATDPAELARGHGRGRVHRGQALSCPRHHRIGARGDRCRAIIPVLERMEEIGMPLLVHGEVTDAEVDMFDREAVFIDRVLDRRWSATSRAEGGV